MNINGTNKNDTLHGTADADVIDAKRGNDWIEGGKGDDIITTGPGSDTVVVRSGDGDDQITDFQGGYYGDRVLFDVGGTYSDYFMLDGGVFTDLYEGATWSTFTGSATFVATAADVNGDGVTDTVVSYDNGVDTGSVAILGLAPADLNISYFYGG